MVFDTVTWVELRQAILEKNLKFASNKINELQTDFLKPGWGQAIQF